MGGTTGGSPSSVLPLCFSVLHRVSSPPSRLSFRPLRRLSDWTASTIRCCVTDAQSAGTLGAYEGQVGRQTLHRSRVADCMQTDGPTLALSLCPPSCGRSPSDAAIQSSARSLSRRCTRTDHSPPRACHSPSHRLQPLQCRRQTNRDRPSPHVTARRAA
jgi:hypothetical protein